MKFLKKKMLSAVLSAAIVMNGAYVAYAAESTTGDAPPKQPSVNEMAKEIAQSYDVNENEVLTALKEERSLDDIYYAAIFAKVSGKSFRQVFAMKSDWFDVMKALGITKEQYEQTVLDMMAKDIAKRSDISESTVRKLLNNHYHPRDISIAGRLAKASKKDIQTVLDMKKLNKRWIDVANDLKVDKNLVRPRAPFEEADADENIDK